MSTYIEREAWYDNCIAKGYKEIEKVAMSSPYPFRGNGKQYFDFTVGGDESPVCEIRILIDFRGEYYSSFVTKGHLPVSITSPIRNAIHMSAKDAYDSIVKKIRELNNIS